MSNTDSLRVPCVKCGTEILGRWRGRSSLQDFLKADAGGIADVGAESGNAGVATGFVEALGFGLADAGFEEDAFVAECAGVAFECGDDEAAEALAANGGDDIHALELGTVGIEGTECAACDGFTAATGNKENTFFAGGLV